MSIVESIVCGCSPTANMQYWIDPVFLYRYLIVIQLLGCIFLLLQFVFLRLHPTRHTAPIVKLMILVCALIPIIQIGVSIVRISLSLDPEFAIKKPMEAYINFFISPMCTTLILWAAQVYMSTSCKCQLDNRGKSGVNATFKWYLVLASIFVGMVFSHGMYTYGNHFHTWDPDQYLLAVSLLSMFMALVEIVSWLIIKNVINVVSYSLVFLVGTWSYFLFLVPK